MLYLIASKPFTQEGTRGGGLVRANKLAAIEKSQPSERCSYSAAKFLQNDPL